MSWNDIVGSLAKGFITGEGSDTASNIGATFAQMIPGGQLQNYLNNLRISEGNHYNAALNTLWGNPAISAIIRQLDQRYPMLGRIGDFLTEGLSLPGVGGGLGMAKGVSFWTSAKSKTAIENAFKHWQKHRAEFPEFQNAKQYVESVKNFFKNPPVGTLTKVRPNGEKLFYNPANNIFGVQAADGTPRTMFRPSDGINYWNKQ